MLPTSLPLTLEQQIARLRFEALIADKPLADAVYDSLPETRKGKIISTDFARYMDEGFRIHVPGRLRDIVPSWEGAWFYAQDRLRREIEARRGRSLLRLMAGGWAAGKTFALEHVPPADLSWDGTLGDPDWAAQIIELALANDWRIQIAYVQRPLELALQGALQRGTSEGRMVPLMDLPAVHRRVQSSIVQLAHRFHGSSLVDFLLLYNSGTSANPKDVIKLRVADIAPGGKLHYSVADVEGFQSIARQIWKQAREDPACPREIVAAAGLGMAKES